MTRGISRTACLAVGLVAASTSGCAAIVGADFDVTARPEPSSSTPDGHGGIVGPTIEPSWAATAPDGLTRFMGLSVAVDGDTALIGARDPDWSGHVFVATRTPTSQWTIPLSLTAEKYAAPSAQFGSAVALSGDWALIGARGPELPSQAGAAYFFHRESAAWVLKQEVRAPAQAPGDKFGARVALENDTAIIAAPGQANAGDSTGVVYVYALEGNSWSHTRALSPDDGLPGDEFGAEVALRYDTLVVGAPSADVAGVDSGAAYVFTRTGGAWDLKQKLGPESVDATGFRFGDGTIGMEEHLLLVPAILGPSGNQINAFATDASGTWVRDALESPSGLDSRGALAWRAAVRNDTAIVAVRTPGDVGMGLVYRRKAGAWQYDERLESGSDSTDVFGWTIAFDGTTACFGAIFFRDREGAAYFFNL